MDARSHTLLPPSPMEPKVPFTNIPTRKWPLPHSGPQLVLAIFPQPERSCAHSPSGTSVRTEPRARAYRNQLLLGSPDLHDASIVILDPTGHDVSAGLRSSIFKLTSGKIRVNDPSSARTGSTGSTQTLPNSNNSA